MKTHITKMHRDIQTTTKEYINKVSSGTQRTESKPERVNFKFDKCKFMSVNTSKQKKQSSGNHRTDHTFLS